MPVVTHRRLLAGGYTGLADDPAPDGSPPSRTAPAGLIALRHDLELGRLVHDGPSLDLPSPSYLRQHPNRRIAYAVGENEQAAVFAITTHGPIDLLRTVTIPGRYPCHLDLTPDLRHLVVANYGDGTVVVIGLDPDGIPTGVTGSLRPAGRGPHPRQDGPHSHHVLPALDGTVWITDLGADRVRRLVIDTAGGVREVDPAIVLEPGTGPRQTRLSSDGHVAYVLGELSGDVLTATRDGAGRWTVVDSQPASPGPAVGANLPAHLLLDDATLYCSNRGTDRITRFDLSGPVSHPIDHITTGVWPRHFSIVGGWLYVADQYDDRITARAVTAAGGEPGLQPPAHAALRRPSCVIALHDHSPEENLTVRR